MNKMKKYKLMRKFVSRWFYRLGMLHCQLGIEQLHSNKAYLAGYAYAYEAAERVTGGVYE